jgi:hypothetical protein
MDFGEETIQVKDCEGSEAVRKDSEEWTRSALFAALKTLALLGTSGSHL